MTFKILTIFPKIFDSYFSESIIKRAQKENKIKLEVFDLRNWTNDKHNTVDDTPYGGGPGMLMKIEPLYKALKDLTQEDKKRKVILFSAQGKKWTQFKAKTYSSKLEEIILICGRYEGVDERITNFIDEEISIGDYVLTGGEIPALVIVDSISRLLPGVLGNKESFKDESHWERGILEYPQYTKPEIFKAEEKEYRVPEILLSGNHQEIEKWRRKKTKRKN